MATSDNIDAFVDSTDTLQHVKSFSSVSDLSKALLSVISSSSAQAIASHNKFNVALSGGSLPSVLATSLSSLEPNSIDFSRWHVYFADERFVPLTDPESNFKLCTEQFLSKVPIPSDNIHPISLPSTNCLEDCAREYQAMLEEKFGYHSSSEAHPIFDLILLGMGPDGHTASLFPFSSELGEVHKWVAPVKKAPKPPPERITLTFPILNRANRVVFVVTGEGKGEVLKRVVEDGEDSFGRKGELPARMVSPGTGKLWWFVDDAAAGKLTKKTSRTVDDIIFEEKKVEKHNIV